MSSRALKRLQGNSGLDTLGPEGNSKTNLEEENESEDEGNVEVAIAVGKKKKNNRKKKGNAKANLFDVLNENSAKSDEEEDDDEMIKAEEEIENVSTEEPKEEVKSVNKSKKKKKKKGKVKENTEDDKKGLAEPTDEIEASLQEVNRILGDPGTVSAGSDNRLTMATAPLLQIDYRNLNPETELRRIFGAEVVRADRLPRGRRNQPNSTRRSGKLVQPKDTWHRTTGSGLNMMNLGGDQGFAFVHSSMYQDLQYTYYEAVQSGNPENIFIILRNHPYHIDTLIQMAEFYRMNEDAQTAAECIEKALYGLESAADVTFNMASGKCHLDYKRHENRALHICLFKHILNIGRRGCYRTAFEFCKLLLSLDRRVDPLNIMYLIDFYAIRSSQYEFLIRLWHETRDSPSSVLERVNFALSVPLAIYHKACSAKTDTKEADELLQDRLLMYPLVLKPLLDKCSVQPDKRVDKHPFFNTDELHSERGELGRIVRMVVERCFPCWKESDVMAWLERNVQKVLDIVDQGQDLRINLYATRREARFKGASACLLRHYLLCEIPNLGMPRSVQNLNTSNMSATDPFPPSDTLTVYTTDRKRPNTPVRRGGAEAAASNRNVLGLLLQSLLPTYDQNAPPEEQEDYEPQAEGARAIPQQIQHSVNAIMDAMRALLTDLRGPDDVPAAPDRMVAGGPGEDEDNEQDWQDEEADFNQHNNNNNNR